MPLLNCSLIKECSMNVSFKGAYLFQCKNIETRNKIASIYWAKSKNEENPPLIEYTENSNDLLVLNGNDAKDARELLRFFTTKGTGSEKTLLNKDKFGLLLHCAYADKAKVLRFDMLAKKDVFSKV